MLIAELDKQYTLPEDLTPANMPATAQDGLVAAYNLMKEGDYEEGYRTIMTSLEMQPKDNTLTMLIYNQACCYSKFRMWKEAADTLVYAINEHKVPLREAIKVYI